MVVPGDSQHPHGRQPQVMIWNLEFDTLPNFTNKSSVPGNFLLVILVAQKLEKKILKLVNLISGVFLPFG